MDSGTSNGSSKGARAGHRSDRMDRSEDREREDKTNIKYEAAMCYLRGLCYAKQNAFDRAKECYKDAVRIDVQCFEAFDQLMKNSLMSPELQPCLESGHITIQGRVALHTMSVQRSSALDIFHPRERSIQLLRVPRPPRMLTRAQRNQCSIPPRPRPRRSPP